MAIIKPPAAVKPFREDAAFSFSSGVSVGEDSSSVAVAVESPDSVAPDVSPVAAI